MCVPSQIRLDGSLEYQDIQLLSAKEDRSWISKVRLGLKKQKLFSLFLLLFVLANAKAAWNSFNTQKDPYLSSSLRTENSSL